MTNEAQDDEASKGGQAEKSADPRTRIIDALMRLAAERTFEEISIREICAAADVTLADFRDAFPSKGAVLGGLSKRIDRAVLSHSADELAAEAPRERLFDVLMRRLDALAPYKLGLEGISEWLRRDPIAATQVNGLELNSMRFMLEAAGIDSEGAVGTLKLQGLVLAWARVLRTWFTDDDPGFATTMALLDRELTKGGKIVARAEDLNRLASPLFSLARAVWERRQYKRTSPRETNWDDDKPNRAPL